MKPFASETDKQERRDTISHLRSISPRELMAEGERLTVAAFHRQVSDVPAYRKMLMASPSADAADVRDITTFKKNAPILDKHNTFGAHEVRELCRGGELEGVRSILTSSGHSGVFSFGVNTSENLLRSSRSIDMGLEYIFGVDHRSTLLINALPMGVKVNTKAAVLAETSVRDDMVFALVKKFASEFDQIIIVAEGSFAKKIIEDGAEYHGIDWKKLQVSLITGEEGIAENYRSYMQHLLGASSSTETGTKLVMSSMGVAELDLNIFHETLDTISIRRLAHEDPVLRRMLFGEAATVCPMFFVYYPTRCFLEEHPTDYDQPELVVSMLSEEMKIPLLRYRTGDLGRMIHHDEVVNILHRCGYQVTPDLKLPFVAVYGRSSLLSSDVGTLSPNEVKEALYGDYEVAGLVTGNFRMKPAPDTSIEIAFQLRKGKRASLDAVERFLENLANINPAKVKADFVSYENFPYMMEVDWERKFRYV